jgi:hypothetical protein
MEDEFGACPNCGQHHPPTDVMLEAAAGLRGCQIGLVSVTFGGREAIAAAAGLKLLRGFSDQALPGHGPALAAICRSAELALAGALAPDGEMPPGFGGPDYSTGDHVG